MEVGKNLRSRFNTEQSKTHFSRFYSAYKSQNNGSTFQGRFVGSSLPATVIVGNLGGN